MAADSSQIRVAHNRLLDRVNSLLNSGKYGSAIREAIANLEAFVFEGAMAEQGMPDFKGKLTAEDVKKLKAFIQGTADSVRGQPAASAKPKK